MSAPTVTLTLEEIRERQTEERRAGRFQAYRVWEELEARARDAERARAEKDARLRARIVEQAGRARAGEPASRWDARLLTDLERRGPATSRELAARIDGEPSGMSTYLSRLKRLGLIEATGERRETSAGGIADVLRCTWSPNGGPS